jgi:hypothetical protein
MTVVELAVIYAAVGAVAGVVTRVRRAPAVDALLTAALWPIYGPFLLIGGGAPVDDRERELLAALRRASATPLGAVLPDEAAGRALARRLRDAAARVRDIDAVLARPDFDVAAARRRAGAALRVQTIERMRKLRDRCAAELDEVDELIAQLVTQAELVRLAGADDGAAAELVRELVARVEGLDALLATE